MDDQFPKLRTVNKSTVPFKLNDFPSSFPYNLGEQLIYILATRGASDIEGKEWEQIFAKSISAGWKPSVVGLDDVALGNTAWGAKSIKAKNPSRKKSIRLISGRNDLINSFNYNVQPGLLPDEHGERVLKIWNARVSDIRQYYDHLRTVVLIRSYDLTENVVFEFNTILFDPELYYWEWAKGSSKKNLYGYEKATNKQKFTWQSGGQQFTIFEDVPEEHLIIKLTKPEQVDQKFVLDKVGFSKNWISVTKTK